jgi:hypothetical protein
MPDTDWYQIVQGSSVFQGDLLMNCPVGTVAELPLPIPDDYQPPVEVRFLDLVVMTQSCDLLNDKVEDVLLAQVIDWAEAVRADAGTNPSIKGKDFRKALIAGNVPGMSLLIKRLAAPTLSWSVVDFHRLVVLPKPFVRRFAASIGPRLRLGSPYLEHLSQAFARYFMRVGLPHPLKDFETEGKVDP